MRTNEHLVAGTTTRCAVCFDTGRSKSNAPLLLLPSNTHHKYRKIVLLHVCKLFKPNND